MRRLLVLALPVILGSSLACSSEGGGDEGDEIDGGDEHGAILELTGDAGRGQSTFGTMMCSDAACHGPDGNSGIAPRLSTLVPSRTDAQIIDSVLEGKAGMPPQDLDDQQMADVLAWLRDTFQ